MLILVVFFDVSLYDYNILEDPIRYRISDVYSTTLFFDDTAKCPPSNLPVDMKLKYQSSP